MSALHNFGGVLGWPLDTFFWALTISRSWSRLLARVWSGPYVIPDIVSNGLFDVIKIYITCHLFFFYKTRIPLCCALVESPPLSILQFCTLLLWREDKSVELNGSWKVCKWELKPVFGIHKIWWQSSFWALDCSFNLKIYEENRSNNRGCYTSFFPFSISREWGRGMLSLKGGGLNFQKYRGSKGGSFHF